MNHILIVEDHEQNRNLLKILLEANGYRVTAAGDGAEALAAARRDPPDAVVSDVQMPNMDGFALCRAWMQDARLSAIPFIFYSGTYVRPDDAEFATALGAVRYLVKPVEAEVFLRELRAVLQQWVGHAAPALAAPLDETASHALHASALARKVEDKMAQLEAANRKLQESEARFRNLIEISSDFYWESDVEHRFTVHNSSSKSSQVLAFQRDAQIGKRRWELPYLSPDEAGWQAHREGLEAHRPFRNFVFSRRGVDGAAHHFAVSGDPVFDASGAFTGYRGVGTDITERKRAEVALQDELQRHRALMDTVIDGIHIVDRDGYLVEANPAFLAMHGYERDEAMGKHLCDWNADFSREQVQANIQRLTNGHDVFETRHRRKDGTVFDVEVSVSGADIGGEQFFYCAARNVTARKDAERQVRRLTRLYALLYRINETIVQAQSKEELFTRICAVACEHAQLLGAIVRLDEDHTGVLRAVAFSESMRRIAGHAVVSNDPALPDYRLPAPVAYREGRLVIENDRLDGPSSTVFMDEKLWIGSIAAIPFRRGGAPIGAVVLVAGEPMFFDDEMCRLMEQMGLDLSMAIDNFEREERNRLAAQALSDSEERFRGLVEQSIAGICIIQDGQFAYANPRFAEIRGYGSTDELIGHSIASMIAEKDRDNIMETIRRLLAGEEQNISSSFTALRKDGSMVEVGSNSARATYRGRPAIIGMLQDISEKKRAEERIKHYVAQLETAFMSTVEVATTLGEMRDPYTAGHQRRVAEIAVAIGAEIGLDGSRQEGLRVAGYLHDIGKITIPSEILSKPGKLSSTEFQLVQGHAQAGYDVLKDVEFPWPVAQVALQHHERMDGSGYPQGLEGEAILLEARIMAVADVVEAMSSHRPYRAGLGLDKALAEIERGRGTAYDENVAEACLRLFREKRYQSPT